MSEPITFDRFVRGLLIVLGMVGVYFLLDALSSVLLPFFVAWMLAYMLYPVITFLEQKCHVRYRLLSIVIALLGLCTILALLFVLFVPPAAQQVQNLSDDLVYYASTYLSGTDVPQQIETYLVNGVSGSDLVQLLKQEDIKAALEAIWQQAWSLFSGTMSVVWFLVDSMMMMLYLFFLLMDYEMINKNWLQLVPIKQRPMAAHLAADIKREMNAYFRGQATVAFLVGLLFSIGFVIIGMPMAIGLGMFVGLLNMVPYAQVLGFLPTIVLALLKANDTGQSFWVIIAMAAMVFIVVQLIQDLFLVPRIMGKAMGLKPAIILLSLSVWGSLLGIIGFIIALPLTTLAWAYYKRFVLKDNGDWIVDT